MPLIKHARASNSRESTFRLVVLAFILVTPSLLARERCAVSALGDSGVDYVSTLTPGGRFCSSSVWVGLAQHEAEEKLMFSRRRGFAQFFVVIGSVSTGTFRSYTYSVTSCYTYASYNIPGY